LYESRTYFSSPTDEAVAKLVMSVLSSRSYKAAQGVLNIEGVRDTTVPKAKQEIAPPTTVPETSVPETKAITSTTVERDIKVVPVGSTAHTKSK
jgi:hypothetical protein